MATTLQPFITTGTTLEQQNLAAACARAAAAEPLCDDLEGAVFRAAGAYAARLTASCRYGWTFGVSASGHRWLRVWKHCGGSSRSAVAFVDRLTGEARLAKSWTRPRSASCGSVFALARGAA